MVLSIISLFLFVFSAPLQALSCVPQAYDSKGILKSISDGDTLRLKDGRKIRLIGINTPELKKAGGKDQPLAREAADQLKMLLPEGSAVLLKIGRQKQDKYGRILAHVFSKEQINITEKLLRQGLGFQVVVGANDWGRDCYLAAEKEARSKRLGVWGDKEYQTRAAADPNLHSGFGLVKGKISKIVRSKRAVWIELEGQVVFKVSASDWPQFESSDLKIAVGSEIEGRGWLIDRNKGSKRLSKKYKRWLIPISHPGMLQL